MKYLLECSSDKSESQEHVDVVGESHDSHGTQHSDMANNVHGFTTITISQVGHGEGSDTLAR